MGRLVLPLSNHARFEMGRRGLSEEVIQSVFQKPQQKIPLESGREIWQNKISMAEKEYILRLVVEKEPEPTIVTVYKSSKIRKYWRES